MKVKCTWVEQEFDGLIPALKVRKIDAILSSMSITEDRKKSVDFTNKLLQHPGAPGHEGRHRGQRQPDELKGKKIGVQRGSIHDRFAKEVWPRKVPPSCLTARRTKSTSTWPPVASTAPWPTPPCCRTVS
jgi:arginine/ornithine transport system substrate-binding protein